MRSVCSGSADGFEDTPGRPLTAVARVTIIARKPDNQETCERLRVSENGATPGGEISVRVDVPCTLSDGTVLRANVYSPVTDEAVPVLLLRHPYSKGRADEHAAHRRPSGRSRRVHRGDPGRPRPLCLRRRLHALG